MIANFIEHFYIILSLLLFVSLISICRGFITSEIFSSLYYTVCILYTLIMIEPLINILPFILSLLALILFFIPMAISICVCVIERNINPLTVACAIYSCISIKITFDVVSILISRFS